MTKVLAGHIIWLYRFEPNLTVIDVGLDQPDNVILT